MGEKTRIISSMLLSNEKVRYITIGIGAIDQNGSYKLELFRKKLPKKWLGRKVINGDKHDLRHLDPKKVVVGLIAKGKAKKDFNGFVQDV